MQACNEIIRALNLEDEPELSELEEQIQAANVELKEHKKVKEVCDGEVKGELNRIHQVGRSVPSFGLLLFQTS